MWVAQEVSGARARALEFGNDSLIRKSVLDRTYWSAPKISDPPPTDMVYSVTVVQVRALVSRREMLTKLLCAP